MSGRSQEEGLKDLTLLGNQGTQYSFEYAPEVLESVDSLHSNRIGPPPSPFNTL